MRERLIGMARERRRLLQWTQPELARCLGSSASRVCKMEAGDESVSLDFIARALRAMGVAVVVQPDRDGDPLTDPEVSTAARRAFGRALLRQGWAKQIAARYRVDALDVAHVLYNLELEPQARLGSALARGRLERRSSDQR